MVISMKHNEMIFNAISGIDADLVAAAAPGNHKKQPAALKKWMPTAACFVLAAVLGIAAWQMHTPDPVDQNDHLYSDTQDTKRATEATAKVETVPATQNDLAVIPRWEERTLPEQFGEFHVGERRYHTRVAAIDAAKVGEKLGSSTSQGYDIYTDTTHNISLDYYAIQGILSECAVAVQFENDDSYYVYVDSWYRPETLEELITALNLRENMTFGDFHASYFYAEDRRDERVTFRDPDDSIVWEWLLSDTSLQNVWNETGWYGSVLSVSVNIPLLGYENISLWVTEDGHLCTNILDTGKAFYIGEEKVNAFVAYVIANCTDREVIVVDYGQFEADTVETAVEGEIVEMTTQGWNPNMPQTSKAQTTAAAPYDPTAPNVTVTSPAYNPQITTSEE